MPRELEVEIHSAAAPRRGSILAVVGMHDDSKFRTVIHLQPEDQGLRAAHSPQLATAPRNSQPAPVREVSAADQASSKVKSQY